MTTTEITPEIKARFFAQYWGQTVYLSFRSNRLHVVRGIIVSTDNIYEDDCLLLTPLSAISDEDAIQVAKIANSTSFLNQIKWDVSSDNEYEFKTISSKWSFHSFDFDTTDGMVQMYDEDKPSGMPLNHYGVFQYLQSRGYALPYYVTELSRTLSVDEQVELGLIKLKTPTA